jgi:hypothetical protein
MGSFLSALPSRLAEVVGSCAESTKTVVKGYPKKPRAFEPIGSWIKDIPRRKKLLLKRLQNDEGS